VKAQTAPVSEIILVDDGAPGDELERFALSEGLRYLRLDGVGVSAARNAGAAGAHGEWLVILEDDDVWHPARIAAQTAALDGQPLAIASHTGGWYMDEEGVRFGTDWSARPATALEMISGRVPLPRITTLIVRHDAFDAIGGFDTRMRMSEDNDLMRRLLMRGDFAAVDRSLVGYRRHPGNVTSRMLDGRVAGRGSIRRLLHTARRHGDRQHAAALLERWHRFRREAAEENLREMGGAARAHDWVYVIRCVGWAVRTAPGQSVRAAARRVQRR
jgi:glycosyltransferase involved in cell wall biosynthesis